ncbi:MAG: 16S rRNA (cytidine(1402)-2'-O)-methyltransferase [Flavobacteriaceae bacterium TMED121]|nr:MAG: 16S rRNA (cytidine(1402)-2'-O)-methyltransferase [Flavobacteriaceae bacterium TMED121]
MGKLFLVPTPIGNLGDMTFRAVETLNQVDLILAEDTRTSIKLLKHFSIQKPLVSFHMHNEHRKLSEVISKLISGYTIAVISDAGTPGISDPGFLLVREAIANEVEVECLPGSTALIPALVLSGLSTERFVFEGFLPPKKGRKKRFENLVDETRTIILYESPHKILKTLNQLIDFFGSERAVSVSRELSKMYEETFRGTLIEAIEYFSLHIPKGEFVICLEGAQKNNR